MATITVRTKEAVYEVDSLPGERILLAGLRSGAPLPYECASGTCGTCRARVKTGEISELWPEAPGRSSVKPERGEFLMCQCIALGDVEILVPGKLPVEMKELVPSHHVGQLTTTEKLTRDVATFSVDVSDPVSFDAGQFFLVQLSELAGYRAYSMVNFAKETRKLDFVIKEKPGGQFSKRLFSQFDDGEVKGDSVAVFGPLGQAIFKPEESRDIFCITGGSGIAGIMSILNRAIEADHFTSKGHKGHVFFGVRTLDDLFYKRELEDFVERAEGNLEVIVAISDQEVSASDGGILGLAKGFVHEAAEATIQRLQGDGTFASPIAFVAGPPPMVDASLRMLLTTGQFAAADIRYDKFN